MASFFRLTQKKKAVKITAFSLAPLLNKPPPKFILLKQLPILVINKSLHF